MKPLDNVTVVALEQAVAGPFATRQLADLGARVIKVERPDGGDFARYYDRTVKGLSSHFVWLNRGKESVAVDVKSDEGRRVLDALIATADVFLCNLSPRAVTELGLDAQDLRRRHPRLIVCQLSGYGSTGAYRDRKAYDLLIQAEAGLLAVTGTEASPARVGISIADISGGMYAYSGILTALLQRERSGEGDFLDLSLLECLGEWMGYPAYYAGYGGTPPARTGTRHATIAPYGDFPTVDGGSVYLAVQNDREWRRFCEDVLDRPELVDDPRFRTNEQRVEHRDALFHAVESACEGFTAAELLERLHDADIANAQLNEVIDFVGHPQLVDRDRWGEVGSPVGTLSALKPPAVLTGFEPTMGAIPALGEHTATVLGELGYDSEKIDLLLEEGIVATGEE